MAVRGTTGKSLAELDAELAGLSVEGHWKSIQGIPFEPAVRAEPHLWRWEDLYPKLLEAGELLALDDGAARRTLRLCNPGLPMKATTQTIHMSVQWVKPGEIAWAHRHTMAAFRFVVQGRGAYTTVEGEPFPWEPGDLILTPQWTWHDHGNETAEPAVWLDVLDVPFVQALDAIFFEPYCEKRQEWTRPAGFMQGRAGSVRPRGVEAPANGLPYAYKGSEALAALRALGEKDCDPYDGRVLEYVNPLTGGPTLPTMTCRLHRFLPGEATRRHRHTWSTIYHVVEGAGETLAGERRLAWRRGDCFVVPNWTWHEHRCGGESEAVLFSVTDQPILAAFALDRAEAV